MRRSFLACICAILCSAAWGQSFTGSAAKSAETRKSAAEQQRERAITRCRENRGVDCDSPAGLKEWVDQERPMTEEQRRAALAARLHRERCRQNRHTPGC